jgi:agmatinase
MSAAHFLILPVPHEATTSYGKGTKRGPSAILKALSYVEEFDEELQVEIRPGIEYMIGKPVKRADSGARIARILADGKIPILLGGEHSITPYAVQACRDHYNDLSVLQLDAHADLRDSYKGKKDSHACVMRRVLEICPAVQVGVRSISKAEWDFAKQSGQIKKIHFINGAKNSPHLNVGNIVNSLSKNVYITVDVDVFDPSVIPATGTPEPGGLLWREVLEILKAVCSAKKVVGFDVVELSPRKGDIASDFTVAKLIYKMMAYA